MITISTDKPFAFTNKFQQELVYNGLDSALTREVYDVLRPQLTADAAQR